MKRIILLVMSLFVLSGTFVYADSGQSVKITQSEYDGIVKILGKSDSDFIEMGLAEEQIIEIKEYKIKLVNNIKMYSQYSEKELERLGFSNIQVKAFKQIKPDNTEILRIDNLSTTQIESLAEGADDFLLENLTRGLTGSVDMSLSVYEVNGDEVTFLSTWEWTGAPIVRGFKDTVGFCWSNFFELTDYDDLDITLKSDKPYGDNTYVVPTSYKNTQDPDESCRAKFPTAADGGYLYRSGECYLTLLNDDNASSTTMAWAYAHGTVQIVGFGIDISGGSISISIGSTEMYNGLDNFTNLN